MTKALTATRYLVIIPIVGLALAAAALFAFGGYGLIKLVIQTSLGILGLAAPIKEDVPVFVSLVEHVHTFLIGTALYITAVGFYQLFIKEIEFPGWLHVTNTEELETNLVGVTVVVLAVNFMAKAFTLPDADVLKYGAGIALPIAALALYLAMRAWASQIEKEEPRDKKTDDELSP